MDILNECDSLQEECQPSDDVKFSGRWTINENTAYVSFLLANEVIVSQKRHRRKSKIFKKMSDLVVTRTPQQCRSHHQKMQERYRTTQGIITFLRSLCRREMDSLKLADQNFTADTQQSQTDQFECRGTMELIPDPPTDPFMPSTFFELRWQDIGEKELEPNYSILHMLDQPTELREESEPAFNGQLC